MKIRVIHKHTHVASEPDTLVLKPLAVRQRWRALRVLDFDIENRPLSYKGMDFTTAEVTAIAWAWTDAPDAVTVRLLERVEDLPDILRAFCVVYQQADVVTGHYIIGHDLPMVNGALLEQQMAPLPDKLVQDTKIHLMRAKGISLSQESLAGMFRLAEPKQGMTQAQWRAANRLTAEGLAEVRRRVVGDVQQHIALRARLLELEYLRSPVLWKSRSGALPIPYTP